MQRFLSFGVLATVLAAAAPAWGHGFLIVNDAGKLVMFSEDPNAGGEPIYTVQSLLGPANFKSADHPGFDIQSGIASGASISFDVLGPLWFDNNVDPPMPSPAGVDLLIEPQDIFVPGSVTVSGTSGFQPGFLIGDYDGSSLGTYEHQLYYSFQVDPAVPLGAYAVAMQLTGFDAQGQPFTPSDPFVTVFNNGLPVGILPAMAGDLFAAATNVPEPSAIVLAGLATIGLLATGRRRWKSSPRPLR